MHRRIVRGHGVRVCRERILQFWFCRGPNPCPTCSVRLCSVPSNRHTRSFVSIITKISAPRHWRNCKPSKHHILRFTLSFIYKKLRIYLVAYHITVPWRTPSNANVRNGLASTMSMTTRRTHLQHPHAQPWCGIGMAISSLRLKGHCSKSTAAFWRHDPRSFETWSLYLSFRQM
jgi:hypothetical protein